MANQEMISNLNASLVKEQPDIKIIDYVKLLNEKILNIDISFIDDFIDLIGNDGFIINHEMLFKYEILTKAETTHIVLRMLENNNLEDGIDYTYQLARVDEGRTEKKTYMLTSDVFKMLCMRSLKTKSSHIFIFC